MIYVNMRGRMGNQLFIYSMAKAVQAETGQKIMLNYYSQMKHDSKSKVDIYNFNIDHDVSVDCTKKLPWFANTDNIIVKIIRRFFPQKTYKMFAKRNVFIWLGETYKDIFMLLDKDKDIYLDGYWQCEKYFRNCRNVISKELIPKVSLSRNLEEMLRTIQSTESVCISVRRGDYVSVPENKAIYYICDEKYFKNGIDKIRKVVNNPYWFVFSDDISWCKENLNLQKNVCFQPQEITPLETLYLMTFCKHFIISNSSFSWWGQYLSENPDKKVIGPSRWYADNRKNDIVQDDWIKISV